MKVFLLGAGLGTRLRPLTDKVPKPLVPFNNKPLLHYAWQACKALGCDDFAINTHHLPDVWTDSLWGMGIGNISKKSHLVQVGQLENTSVRLVHEPILLDTGGGLRNVKDWMGSETVLVHNGDIFSTMDLAVLVAAHEASGLPATLALRSSGTAKHIAINAAGDRVIDIRGKLGEAEGTHVFSGIYCVNAELLEHLPDEEIVSVIPAFLALAKKNQLGAVVIDQGLWLDMGERVSYLQGHNLMVSAERIDPTARIMPGAIIENSVVGKNAIIEAGAVVKNSVVWQNAHVCTGAELDCCIVYSDRKIAGRHVESDL